MPCGGLVEAARNGQGRLVEAARNAPYTLSEADKATYSVFSGAVAEKDDGSSIVLGAGHGAK